MKTPLRWSALVLAPALFWTGLAAQPQPAAPAAPKQERSVATVRLTAGLPPAAEPVTFLGVETSRVSPTLTEQLGLQKEVGLVVNAVLPDSPAAGALRRHDILLKLNDQLLIGTEQLGVLVRSFKEGDEVTLTYVRGGKQETARVRLARRTLPHAMGEETGGEAWEHWVPSGGGASATLRIERLPGALPREEVDRVLSLAGRGAGFTYSAGPAPIARIVEAGRSHLVFSDDEGSLELKVDEESRKELTARDAAGAVLFRGPIDTEAERKALPGAVRLRLEKMEGIDTLHFRIDGDFRGGDVKIVAPRAGGVSLRRASAPRPASPVF